MEKTWKELVRKRSLESQGQGSSKKARRKQRLEETKPKVEEDDTQWKIIEDIKSEGQRLTEKEKSKKVLLKKLQKLWEAGGKSQDSMTATSKTPKDAEVMREIKTEHPKPHSDELVMKKWSETGETSQKSHEISEVMKEESKQKIKMKGCFNKEDAEWHLENVNKAFEQLKSGLLKNKLLSVLMGNFMREICNSMQCIKLQPEIRLAEVNDIIDTTWQLAATTVYFLWKNLFGEANVELIAKQFQLKKQKLYKLVTGKKFKGVKVSK